MKKIFLLALIIPTILLNAGCGLFQSKSDVYITVDTVGGQLFTVKFTEPAENAGNYTNEFSSYTGKVNAAGYEWYVYKVADGNYDAYIEWTEAGNFLNGRSRIIIDSSSESNTWVAVYADTGGNTWAEEGSGTFSPQLYYYP